MVRTLFHGLCEKFQRYPSFTIFVIKRNPNKWLLFYFSFLAIYFIDFANEYHYKDQGIHYTEK